MSKNVLLGLCGLLLAAGAASAYGSAQGPERARSHAGARCERDGGAAGRRQRLHRRVRRGREFVRSLGVSEEQRELARQASRELTPRADELRPQARAIVERARALRLSGDRDGARELLRNELRPLLESAKPDAERAVDPLLRSLTPEQRAKLEAAAQRRGKQFDEQRFAHRLGLALASKRAQGRVGRTR
jgi:hypothetical protein